LGLPDLGGTFDYSAASIGAVTLQLPAGYWQVDLSGMSTTTGAISTSSSADSNYAYYDGTVDSGEIQVVPDISDVDLISVTQVQTNAYLAYRTMVRSTGYLTPCNLDTDAWAVGGFHVRFPGIKPERLFIHAMPANNARPWSSSEIDSLEISRIRKRLEKLEDLKKEPLDHHVVVSPACEQVAQPCVCPIHKKL
jgi:hypothetical protein